MAIWYIGWIHIAVNDIDIMGKIPSLKSNKKYKDAPRYKLIYDYEGDFKKAFKNSVDKSLSLIGKNLAKESKK